MKIPWKTYAGLVVLFLCGMVLFFYFIPRWEYVSPNLILNGSFDEDFHYWNLHGQGSPYVLKDGSGTRLHLNGQDQAFQGLSQEIHLLKDQTLYSFSFAAQAAVPLSRLACPGSHP